MATLRGIKKMTKNVDNPTNFDYIPIDYSLYSNFNDLPERIINPSTNLVGLPEFIMTILLADFIKPEGKKDFFLKFGIYYATDPEFRRITDNYSFLFLEGLYYGAYPSENDAIFTGYDIKKKDGINYSMFVSSVHIKNVGVEYKEVINAVSKSKVFEIHQNEKNFIYESE